IMEHQQPLGVADVEDFAQPGATGDLGGDLEPQPRAFRDCLGGAVEEGPQERRAVRVPGGGHGGAYSPQADVVAQQLRLGREVGEERRLRHLDRGGQLADGDAVEGRCLDAVLQRLPQPDPYPGPLALAQRVPVEAGRRLGRHSRKSRTAAIAAPATAAEEAGFWPVTRFPSRRTFAVNGAATSTAAPRAASRCWSENGMTALAPAASSSASLKAVTVRPATSGFPPSSAAPSSPAGPWQTAATTPRDATLPTIRASVSFPGKSHIVPWPPARKTAA